MVRVSDGGDGAGSEAHKLLRDAGRQDSRFLAPIRGSHIVHSLCWCRKQGRRWGWALRYSEISMVVFCSPWIFTNSNNDLALSGLSLMQPWETARPRLRISVVPWMAYPP